MSSGLDKAVKDIIQTFQEAGKNKPAPFDTQAEVLRVDGDTAWVHIPGGVDETPVKLTINAKVGDKIQVHVGGGRAWITGNATAPPTDDRKANIATEKAETAGKAATSAAELAESAMTDAEKARAAAISAETSANNAQGAAESATTSANSALIQLSTVESVVGTLNWIAEHGTYELTTDTQVVNGKLYFAKVDNEYVVQTLAEDADPQALGLYELASVDEAVTNYIASHLALTSEGLSIVNDDQSGRALFSPTGVTIYNAMGEPVAQYGENTVLGDPNGIHIEITGEQLGFYEGSSALTDPVAYISNQQLYIPRAVVVDSMQVGDSGLGAWQWAISPTSRNLRLIWIGGQ